MYSLKRVANNRLSDIIMMFPHTLLNPKTVHVITKSEIDQNALKLLRDFIAEYENAEYEGEPLLIEEVSTAKRLLENIENCPAEEEAAPLLESTKNHSTEEAKEPAPEATKAKEECDNYEWGWRMCSYFIFSEYHSLKTMSENSTLIKSMLLTAFILDSFTTFKKGLAGFTQSKSKYQKNMSIICGFGLSLAYAHLSYIAIKSLLA